MPSINRTISILGITGVALYIFSAIYGSAITPNYDPMLRTISMLVYIGAPHKHLLDILFIISHSLLLLFSIGLITVLGKSMIAKIGSILLSITAFLQIALFIFLPVQSMYDKMSTIDRLHQNIVSVSVGLLIIAIVLVGYGITAYVTNKRFTIYSLITSSSLLIVGLITFHEIISRSEIRGMWERIMIGIFLQWILVTSIRIYYLKRTSD